MAQLDDVARVPRPTRPAILFCIFTSFGYGHLSRLHRVARALLTRARVDAYVIGCQPGFTLGEPVDGLHEVDLPAPTFAAAAPLRELPALADQRGVTPDMSAEALSVHKSRLLLALVRRLQPVAIAIDSFPFAAAPGRDAAECEESLAYLATHAPATLRCAGFRGIASVALDASGRDEARRLVETYLDLLLLYVDGRERDEFFGAHPHLRSIAERTRFVRRGHARDRAAARVGDQPRAVGGGAEVPALRRHRPRWYPLDRRVVIALIVLDSAATSPTELAALMTDLLAAPPATRLPLDMGGAETAAAILHDELARRDALPR